MRLNLVMSVKSSASFSVATPVYISPARKLDRFRGKNSTVSIQEWIADVKGQILARNLSPEIQAPFAIENLAGPARQEILGRGEEVCRDVDQVFRILSTVFGEGDTLPMLQQRFFSYRQTDEDVITCSLTLVDLYDRIVQFDRTFGRNRDDTLKGRFAEAVKDELLQRELRRLNMDSPNLSFFDMRDRAIQWLGPSVPKQTCKVKVATLQETTGYRDDSHDGVFALIERQQKQIDDLVDTVKKMPKYRNKGDKQPFACYACGSPDHMKRDCPKRNNSRAEAGKESSSLNG